MSTRLDVPTSPPSSHVLRFWALCVCLSLYATYIDDCKYVCIYIWLYIQYSTPWYSIFDDFPYMMIFRFTVHITQSVILYIYIYRYLWNNNTYTAKTTTFFAGDHQTMEIHQPSRFVLVLDDDFTHSMHSCRDVGTSRGRCCHVWGRRCQVENCPYRWFTWVCLLEIVIFQGKLWMS